MLNDTIVSAIKTLAKEKGVSVNNALIESGVKKDFIANMQKGSCPSVEKLLMIADYFGVSVDYLLGRKKKNETKVNRDTSTVSIDITSVFNPNNDLAKYASYIYQALIDLKTSRSLLQVLLQEDTFLSEMYWIIAYQYLTISICESARLVVLTDDKVKKFNKHQEKLMQLDVTTEGMKNNFAKLWATYGEFITNVRHNFAHYDHEHEKNVYFSNMIKRIGAFDIAVHEGNIYEVNNTLSVELIIEIFKSKFNCDALSDKEAIVKIIESLDSVACATYSYLNAIMNVYWKNFTAEKDGVSFFSEKVENEIDNSDDDIIPSGHKMFSIEDENEYDEPYRLVAFGGENEDTADYGSDLDETPKTT